MSREADDLKHVVTDVVRAWETLTGGRLYTSERIQEWLIADMTPAIDRARIALGREPGKRHHG